MSQFTPLAAAIGGALIGLSAALLALLTGRIAGISGIFGGLLTFAGGDRAWRIAFVLGLVLAPLLTALAGLPLARPQMPADWLIIVALAGCWSVSAPGSPAAAPPATACAASRGCRRAR